MVTRHSPLATRLRRAKPRGHFPTPHNRLHRRTLPCLPRAPNSFSKWWPVFRRVGLRLHNQPHPRPARQSQHKPLQLQPLPHLRHQRTLLKHPLHPHNPPVILSGARLLRSGRVYGAKDLTLITPPRSPTKPNPPPPNPLRPLPQPLNPTTRRRHAHPRVQTGTPLGSISATPATSPQTAISFRINTYTTPTSVDSKPLTSTLSPLSATLTKNPEGGRNHRRWREAPLLSRRTCNAHYT